jgi:O-antigen/teichoic acid export membrane protein
VATKVTLLALGVCASVVISHTLGPQGRGAYYVITTIGSTAIVLGSLSLDQAQITLWTHPGHRLAITANSVILGPMIGVAAAAVAAALVIGLGPGIVPIPSLRLLAVALAAVPAGTTVIYLINVLTLRSRMEVVNRGYLIGAAAQCLPLIVLGVAGNLSVSWVIIVWTLAMALPLVILLPAVRGTRAAPSPRLARRTIGLGLRYHAGTAAYYLLLRADIFILNALEPTTVAVGLYSLAATLAELTKLLTESLVPIMMPEQVQARDSRAATVTAATVRMSTLLSCCSVAAMCVAAPTLIPFVYGPEFRGADSALLALAPGLLALGAAKPMSTYLLRLSRPVPMSLMFLAGLAINICLNFALIPRWGIVGASIASSVAYIILTAVQTAWFVTVTGTKARELIPGRGEFRLFRQRLPQLLPVRWQG